MSAFLCILSQNKRQNLRIKPVSDLYSTHQDDFKFFKYDVTQFGFGFYIFIAYY